jgi:hypothetical protein
MFEGFTRTEIETSGARIHLRHGGDGPPLLLLHGSAIANSLSPGTIAAPAPRRACASIIPIG